MLKKKRLSKGWWIKLILFASGLQFFFSIVASAQYYPAPPAVEERNEPALLSMSAIIF